MSSRVRSAAVTATWCTALGAAIAVLVDLGHGVLAAPPMADRDELRAWIEASDGFVAAFAVLRLLALAIAGYLAAVTVLRVLAGATRRPGLIRIAELATVPAVRRMLGGCAGLGLTASAATLAVGATVPRLDVPAVVLDHDGTGPIMVAAHIDDDRGGTATMRVVEAEVDPAPGPTEWVVQQGQSMWSRAESTLATAWGRAPSDAEIVPYWQALIDANRDRLVDSANADLIFTGQRFVVPPPPTR